MLAARIVAPRRMEMVEVPEPELPPQAEGALLVQTRVGAVCGSDLPKYSRELKPKKYPLPDGHALHECIGTVVGSRSARFREGDAVLALPDGSCGLAERFLSHEQTAVPLPGGSLDETLVMAQPLGTVICALRRLPSPLDADVVVLGQGPMGLMFTQMLAAAGARRIVAVEPVPHRRALAARLGATHTVDPAGCEDLAASVREATGGRLADLVVEAVGHQTHTLDQAIDLVRLEGTILAFGVPDDPVYPIRFQTLFRRKAALVSSVQPDPQRDFPLALDLVHQGRYDPRPLLSHRLPLARAPEAFRIASERGDGVVKVLITHD